jgi:hypothetical protein
MGIKDLYYYVFYKIYQLLEMFARPNWLIKSRARGLFFSFTTFVYLVILLLL